MKTQTAFRLKTDQIESLKAIASKRGISLNQLVSDIIDETISASEIKFDEKEFKTFKELETYFKSNMKSWKLQAKATKVIGKKILIFSKT